MTPSLRKGVQWWWLLSLLALWGVPVLGQSTTEPGFLSALGELRDADFPDKEAIVERLTQSAHSSTYGVLTAFLEDRLYFKNDDQKVFIVKSVENEPTTFDLLDPLTLKDAGSIPADQVTKIGTNNRLRRVLRTTIARFGLASPDAAVRLQAVQDMLRSLDEGNVTLLRERADSETAPSVKKAIATGLALADLDSTDSQTRLNAVEVLKGSLNADARNKLATLLEKSPDGTFVETDEKVRTAAEAAVATIDDWRSLYSAIETLFFGLSLGSVLVLVAIGLAITFGVMGVINMAHGELMMLGAYTTYVVQTSMPGVHRPFDIGGHPCSISRRGPDRNPDRTNDHPLSVRETPGDSSGDVRRQPDSATARPIGLLSVEP